nr:hypothetical protein BaRGS_027111 [Batillaria attramentaria]
MATTTFDFVTTDSATPTVTMESTVTADPVTEDDIPADLFDTLNHKKAMARLPTIIYLVILMIVGVVGNSMVFFVYYRRFKPSATRTFVLAMSVFDLGSNIVAIPNEIYDLHVKYTFDNRGLCRVMRFSNMFLALVSGFILVAVALDRYRKICRPLHKQHSLRRTTVSIVVCAGVSVALTIPFTVLNGRQTVDTGKGNITGFMCSTDDEFVHTKFPVIYNVILGLTLITTITTMIVSYARIAQQLFRHKRSSARSIKEAGFAGRGGSCSSGGRKGSSNKNNNSDLKEESDSVDVRVGPPEQATLLAVRNVHNAVIANSVPEAIPLNEKVLTTAKEVPSTDSNELPLGQMSAAGSAASDTPEDSSSQTPDAVADPAESEPDEQGKQSADAGSSSPDVKKESSVPEATENAENTKSNSLLQSVLSKDPNRQNSLSKDPNRQNTLTASPTQTLRQRRSTVKKIPTSTTFMMFVLTAVFIINYLPTLTVFTLRAAMDDVDKGLTGAELNAYNIALRSYFINCAVNSLVYGFCSVRFRRQCKKIFTRRIR